jgi:hypothetical protein
MDKLAPKLIRRAAKKNYIAIIIDPIYKIITGDENSADQMANFCNQFDKVCTDLGAAVIYCHHHSKGSQGGKRSMDRASGSGVFARDPDALLDYIELDLTEELFKQEENKAVCAVCEGWLKAKYRGWEDEVSQDDLCSESQMLTITHRLLGEKYYPQVVNETEAARQKVRQKTAWRIDGTLREFPKFAPVNLWFDYPTHHIDDVGSLKDIEPESEKVSWKGNFKKKKKSQDRKKERLESLETAIKGCTFDGIVTVRALAEYMGAVEKTVRNRVREHPKYEVIQGEVREKVEKK